MNNWTQSTRKFYSCDVERVEWRQQYYACAELVARPSSQIQVL